MAANGMRVLAPTLLALLLLSLPVGQAFAHGGVSVEDDQCILTAGLYRAHFTGYQPTARGSQEFCEDIPVVDRAIIVVDFIDRALREMHVDVRIIRDVDNIGNNATFEDLGSTDDIERATLHYRAPALYPSGTVSVSYDFTEPGRYIGLVTAQRPGGRANISIGVSIHRRRERHHALHQGRRGDSAVCRRPLLFLRALSSQSG